MRYLLSAIAGVSILAACVTPGFADGYAHRRGHRAAVRVVDAIPTYYGFPYYGQWERGCYLRRKIMGNTVYGDRVYETVRVCFF